MEVLPSALHGITAACDDPTDAAVVFWHLVRCGHLDDGLNYTVLDLAARFVDEASPSEIMDLLVKLPSLTVLTGNHQPFGGKRRMQLRAFLPEVDEVLEELLWSAWRRGPDVVSARAADLSPALQTGLAFVRMRCGDDVGADERAAVAAGLRATLAGADANMGLTLRVLRSLALPGATQERVDRSAKLLAPDEVATSTRGEVMALFAP